MAVVRAGVSRTGSPSCEGIFPSPSSRWPYALIAQVHTTSEHAGDSLQPSNWGVCDWRGSSRMHRLQYLSTRHTPWPPAARHRRTTTHSRDLCVWCRLL